MCSVLGLVMVNEGVMREMSKQGIAEPSVEPSDNGSEEAPEEDEIPKKPSRKQRAPDKEGSFFRVPYHEVCDIQCVPHPQYG